MCTSTFEVLNQGLVTNEDGETNLLLDWMGSATSGSLGGGFKDTVISTGEDPHQVFKVPDSSSGTATSLSTRQ
jgi:hypothetical protein